MTSFLTHSLGFPRIGERRELKRALEAHWAGQLSAGDLQAAGRVLGWHKLICAINRKRLNSELFIMQR